MNDAARGGTKEVRIRSSRTGHGENIAVTSQSFRGTAPPASIDGGCLRVAARAVHTDRSQLSPPGLTTQYHG